MAIEEKHESSLILDSTNVTVPELQITNEKLLNRIDDFILIYERCYNKPTFFKHTPLMRMTFYEADSMVFIIMRMDHCYVCNYNVPKDGFPNYLCQIAPAYGYFEHGGYTIKIEDNAMGDLQSSDRSNARVEDYYIKTGKTYNSKIYYLKSAEGSIRETGSENIFAARFKVDEKTIKLDEIFCPL